EEAADVGEEGSGVRLVRLQLRDLFEGLEEAIDHESRIALLVQPRGEAAVPCPGRPDPIEGTEHGTADVLGGEPQVVVERRGFGRRVQLVPEGEEPRKWPRCRALLLLGMETVVAEDGTGTRVA